MKKVINFISKILLILSFIIISKRLYNGELNIWFYLLLFMLSTIGVLKTNEKNSKLILIMGIISFIRWSMSKVLVSILINLGWFILKILGILKDQGITDFIWSNYAFSISYDIHSLNIIFLVIGIMFFGIYFYFESKRAGDFDKNKPTN